MKRLILAALMTLALPACAAPAAAQTVSGCGTTAIAKADQNSATRLASAADCFGKAKTIAAAAEQARRARIVAITPAVTTPTVVWKLCATEGQTCRFDGTARVRYGAGGTWAEKSATGSIDCGNASFGGDPAFGTVKQCETTAAVVKDAPLAAAPVGGGSKPIIAAGARAWPVPAKPTDRRGLLGINVAGVAWWNGEQTYVNMLRGGAWRNEAGGWADLPRDLIDPDGIPRADAVSATMQPILVLTPPVGSRTGDVPVVCTWEGKGDVFIWGTTKADDKRTASSFSFTWLKNADNGKFNWLRIHASDPANPIRSINCRAKSEVGSTSLFTRQILDYYRSFGTLRFLDASGVNGSAAWRWATRSLPRDLTLGGNDGMPLEHQVQLGREVDADIWLNISYNADEDYQRRMAQLIHELMAGTSRHVYVELSNEVWNFSFGVAHQLRGEGIANNLSGDGDGFKSGLFTYAKRTADLMRIWTDVFKDRPGQLVRVVAGQSDNPWVGAMVVGESGLGASGLVDVYSVAPYFGGGILPENPAANDNEAFAKIQTDMTRVLTQYQSANLATAKRYGLRLVSYEAGQHLVDGHAPERVARMNGMPQMGDLYRAYLPRAVASNDGDLVVLYAATGTPGPYGDWGLRRYAGQPIAETPKLRAVQEYAAGR